MTLLTHAINTTTPPARKKANKRQQLVLTVHYLKDERNWTVGEISRFLLEKKIYRNYATAWSAVKKILA